jgi:protoporphyrinogen oxidase
MNVNDPSFPFVGVIEHTNFEPASSYSGKHIVYLSKYLHPESPLYALPDTAWFDLGLGALQRMFPNFSRELVKGFHVWRADFSQPVIERGYSSTIPAMETPLQNVFLSTMAQVYPEDRGTNYAVRGGLQAAALVKSRIKATRSTATRALPGGC